MCEERKNQEPEDQKQYGQHAGQWFSFRQSADKTVHHEIKDAHSAHDDQVDDHRPERPHFRIMNAQLRQCEFALKFLPEHLIPPPLWQAAYLSLARRLTVSIIPLLILSPRSRLRGGSL